MATIAVQIGILCSCDTNLASLYK